MDETPQKPRRRKQKYEDKLTEVYRMRVTPAQKQLLMDVSPDVYAGGMSKLWRYYIIYLANLIKLFKDNKIDEQSLYLSIDAYARELANDIQFQFKMEKLDANLAVIMKVKDDTGDNDVPF